ncbi:MAG: Nramp family divalent metal transporter [Candidatus Falkowbacteria bacterium]
MPKIKDKQAKEFPASLPLKQLLGPSFIILALGLGSGEIILWPYLVSNYGLGIIWGAFLGLTFQFFVNMEIERYALVKGESVFVGLRRRHAWAPYWFIVSTFLGFGLPGIIAASAQILASVWGVTNFKWLAIILLLLVGLILSIGKTVYESMEKITQVVIILGVPFILMLVYYLTKAPHVGNLFLGLAGVGQGYFLLPAGISLATFLAAFAFSGAGGNLNLSQSIYIKEKGYGMGKYTQKMSGFFRASKGEHAIRLDGHDFAQTPENFARFQDWWRLTNKEHAIVFWGVGLVTILLLALLSYSTVYGQSGNLQGISFVIREGAVIGGNLLPWIGSLFLLVIGLMLFQTQLGVMDSTSRIMSENKALLKLPAKGGQVKADLSRIYYIFLWAQIAFGIILFLFNIYEPKTLLILQAVANAVAMFVHVGLVYRLNRTLPVPCQPVAWRRWVIGIIFGFLGVFSLVTLVNEAMKFF